MSNKEANERAPYFGDDKIFRFIIDGNEEVFSLLASTYLELEFSFKSVVAQKHFTGYKAKEVVFDALGELENGGKVAIEI